MSNSKQILVPDRLKKFFLESCWVMMAPICGQITRSHKNVWSSQQNKGVQKCLSVFKTNIIKSRKINILCNKPLKKKRKISIINSYTICGYIFAVYQKGVRCKQLLWWRNYIPTWRNNHIFLFQKPYLRVSFPPFFFFNFHFLPAEFSQFPHP